jgi:hypothetical protein
MVLSQVLRNIIFGAPKSRRLLISCVHLIQHMKFAIICVTVELGAGHIQWLRCLMENSHGDNKGKWGQHASLDHLAPICPCPPVSCLVSVMRRKSFVLLNLNQAIKLQVTFVYRNSGLRITVPVSGLYDESLICATVALTYLER